MADGFLDKSRNGLMVERTSSFDLAFYIIFSRMTDDEQFKSAVLNGVDAELKTFMISYLTKGLQNSTYLARNKVLMKHFKTEEITDMRIKTLNCESSVAAIIAKMFVNEFPSAVIKTTCSCRTRKEQQTAVTVFEFDQNESSSFDLLRLYQPKVCGKCHDSPSVEIDLGSLVFIDMKDMEFNRHRIPQVILVEQKVCILHSIVEHITCEGRYVAHIRRSNQIWYSMDVKARKITTYTTKRKRDERITVHLLSYAFPSAPKPNSSDNGKAVRKAVDFEIIKNFHSIILNGMKININNSCGPDALLHILCNIWHEEMDLSPKNDKSVLLRLIEAYHANDQVEVYKNRAILILMLQDQFEISVVSFKEISVNCDSNVYHCLQWFCSDIMPSAINSRKCKCQSISRNVTFVDLDYQKLVMTGIESISACILSYKPRKSICSTCEEPFEAKTIFSNILFFDVQPVVSNEMSIYIGKTKIDSIPSITVGGKSYALKGIAEYNDNAKHFVAHCQKNDTWIKYDDLSPTTQRSPSSVQPHVLVYIKSN